MIPFLWNIQNRQVHRERKISNCQGLGGEMGSEYEGVWGLILEGWKYSGIIQWWWLYDLMNILKTTEKVDFMVWELYLNFFFF